MKTFEDIETGLNETTPIRSFMLDPSEDPEIPAVSSIDIMNQIEELFLQLDTNDRERMLYRILGLSTMDYKKQRPKKK